MKFTLLWLKRFLDTESSPQEISTALTSIGLEVEEIIDKRAELKDFTVAHIISVRPHPSADKLQICQVQTKEEILQIVCGASNARSDIKVVLAKIGSLIPTLNAGGQFKIKESMIRGEKSFGMLCSAAELAIGSDGEGIIELPTEAIVGSWFGDYYNLNDPVFNINVTPNRGDALGVYGIARDLAAKGLGKLKHLEIPEISAKFQSELRLTVDNKQACPLFSIVEIRNLQNKQSPDWLKQLLQNVGLSPISAVVDVTNFISYSFNQPMHAYNRNKLADNIGVGNIRDEDIKLECSDSLKLKFLALNDKEYDLLEEDLLIFSGGKVQGIAGIIGGVSSSCDLDTTNIILEAACFTPKSITKTGRRLQIDTDSRYRFERNIDQSFTIKALNIASQMILSICGGEAAEIIIAGDLTQATKLIEFPVTYLEKITGLKLSAVEISEILDRLGFKPVITGELLNLTIPAWRHDIFINEDIVEEIIRIHGYDKLEIVPLPDMQIGRIIPKEQKRIIDIKRIFAHQGYDEVVTNSFMDSRNAKLFALLKDELTLLNPISGDNDYMRPSILPNLLKIISKNLARSINDISIFEFGPVFLACNDESNSVSGVRCGQFLPRNCHLPSRDSDVFDIKLDLETALGYMGLSLDKCNLSEAPFFYHPTKSASIKLGKNLLGCFGQIHPSILKHFDINIDVFAFELNIANIPFSKPKFAKKDEFIVSDFQVNYRDYAFVIDFAQAVGDIISCIRNINKKLIRSVELFDIYVGDKLLIGKKSIAIRVQVQSDERTLTEIDLNLISKEIITLIEQKFDGKLRD